MAIGTGTRRRNPEAGNRNGGGPRPRDNGGEVRKSVSYISFIGGLFGFGQIKRNQVQQARVHSYDGQFQATRFSKNTAKGQYEEHSSENFSLGHELSLVAQFIEANPHGSSPPSEMSGSRAGCAVPKICKSNDLLY